MRTVKFNLRVDLVSPEARILSASRQLWDEYVADIIAIPALTHLMLGFTLTKHMYNPTVAASEDVSESFEAFLAGLDWSILDGEPRPKAHAELQAVHVLLCTRDYSRNDWTSLTNSSHNSLIRSRVSPRTQKILSFVETEEYYS